MKKVNLFLNAAIFAAIVSFSACFHASAQTSEPVSTWNFGAQVVSFLKEVDANTVNGNITVTDNTGSEATVEMYISVNNNGIRRRRWSDEEIKQELEKSFTIDVKVEGEKLFVVARPKTNGRQILNISFKITTPKSINSSLRSVNGGISIKSLSGSHDIRTVNGSLNVDNISDTIYGSTVNGGISATNSNGKITLTTVNGSINISDVSGVISTSTVNGRVTERNVRRE